MTGSARPRDQGAPVRRIAGVEVSAVGRDEAIARMVAAVVDGGSATFAFCNAHTANLARGSSAFRGALARATVWNDGVGMNLAARLLDGAPYPANNHGTDLTPALLAALPADTPVFLLGSPAGVAEEARDALRARFPALAFVGVHHGWFTPDEEPQVDRLIRDSGARLVIIGMGQPRQELWAARHAAALDAVLLCAGAYLDFAAGRFRRAPAWVQRARLEWAFRLALEPRRLARRYLIGNAAFLGAAILERRRRR